MVTASLNELKKELKSLDKNEIVEACLRLAKFKKDNKELLNYCLFEAQNPNEYAEKVKQQLDIEFSELGRSNLYLINKSLRKILRSTNKWIKYTGSKQIEVELLIYFCQCLNKSGIKFRQSASIYNLYQTQLNKIEKSMGKLHEDLQFDFRQELEKL